MASINGTDIGDFLVFKENITIEFCKGINVFIGGNGTGKTTLIKVLYWQSCLDNISLALGIEHYFGVSSTEIKSPINPQMISGSHDTKAVFIPVTEMLSHSKGFLALYREPLLRLYAKGESKLFIKKVVYLLFINSDTFDATGLNDKRFTAFKKIEFDLVNADKLHKYGISCTSIA